MKSEFEYIEWTVDANGIKTEAHGFTGKGCLKATEKIEKAMGENTERSFKLAFHKVVSGLKERLSL